MSFMDAFIPNAPARCAERNSAAFGWWSAQLKPGLTDSHVTARDPADWSTRDTRTSIRASLELACLDFCNSKRRHLEERAKVLREKVETDGMGGEAMPEGAPSMLRELGPFLPPRSPSPVIRWSPDDISQSKCVSCLVLSLVLSWYSLCRLRSHLVFTLIYAVQLSHPVCSGRSHARQNTPRPVKISSHTTR